MFFFKGRPEKDRKIILSIIGYYGYGNFGDDLMLRGICDNLPEDRYEIFLHTRRRYEGLRANICQKKIIPRISILNYIRSFLRSSVVMWGGGTCLYEPVDKNFSGLRGLRNRLLLAKLFRCKTVLFGIGIGSVESKKAKKLQRQILNFTDEVYARDEASYKELETLFGGQLYRTEDPVYLLSKSSFNAVEKKDALVVSGVGTSNVVEHALKFANLINTLANDLSVRVIFISLHDGIDDKFFEAIQPHLSPELDYTLESNISTVDKVKSLGSASYVLGVRLHSILVSDMLSTPVIGIAYHDKVIKYLSENGQCIESRLFLFSRLGEVKNAVDSLLEQQSEPYIDVKWLEKRENVKESLYRALK